MNLFLYVCKQLQNVVINHFISFKQKKMFRLTIQISRYVLQELGLSSKTVNVSLNTNFL